MSLDRRKVIRATLTLLAVADLPSTSAYATAQFLLVIFMCLSNDERKKVWDFVQALLEEELEGLE